MIFRFLILSDEVEDFKREIQIDADASFLDLHHAIIQSAGYSEGEIASFFICTDNWEREREITLIEMDTSPEEDSYTMDASTLGDFLEDEHQKLMYVFDYLTERAFFIDLREIITGKHLEKAQCTRSEGEAPAQIIEFEAVDISTVALDTDEVFYGTESYDMDELDADGFDGLDNVPSADSEDF